MLALSLQTSPPLKNSLRFYTFSIFSLIVFALYQYLNLNHLDNRWNSESIVLTHIFTIGFLFPIVLGSITQLLPVLFGIIVNKNIFNCFLISIPASLISYVISFHYNETQNNLINIVALSLLWLNLTYLLVAAIKQSVVNFVKQKKDLYLFLCFSLLNLFVAILSSIYLILIHYGYELPLFRPHITNLHAQLMLLGFLHPLIISILLNVIPMFYITKPLNKYLTISTLFVSPILYIKIIFLENSTISNTTTIIICLINFVYSLALIKQLYCRKRKNKDSTIYFWYLVYTFAIVTNLVWLLNSLNIIENEIILGKFIFLGFILSIVVVMLLKIIPFLSWLHISQEQAKRNQFHIKIPHLGKFITNKEKNIILFFLVINFLLNIQNFYRISSLCLLIISMLILRLIINSYKIYKESMKSLSAS